MTRIIICLTTILFLLLLILFCQNRTQETFMNYLSVADNRDLYVRYLDYLHGGYQIPNQVRMNMGYYIYDIYGFPHFVNTYSDPYLMRQNVPHFKGHYFHMPHDRKIIKVG